MSITYDPIDVPALEAWRQEIGTARAVYLINKELDARGRPVIGDATFRIWQTRRVPAGSVISVVAASGVQASDIRPDLFR